MAEIFHDQGKADMPLLVSRAAPAHGRLWVEFGMASVDGSRVASIK
jgi:hypothetical protein